MGYIYKITNDINNKFYIGQTNLFNPELRWKRHKTESTWSRAKKRPLYDAINKYGIKHFHFEVLEEVEEEQLNTKEQYYIEFYRTYIGFEDSNGYNATLGGDSYKRLVWTEEEKKNIITDFNNHNSITDICRKYHHTYNTIATLLQSYGFNTSKIKTIAQVNKNTGEVIEIFETIKDAERKTGIQNSHISECCRGLRLSAGGFLWIYEQDL